MSDEVNLVTRNYELLLYLRSFPARPARLPTTAPPTLPAIEPACIVVLLTARL